MLDEDTYLDFAGFEPNYSRQALLPAGEREVRVEDVENWLEENHSDPGYQVFSAEEIAELVMSGDQPGENSSSESEDEVVVRQKMSQVRDCLTLSFNMLMRQITVTFKAFMNTSAY